MTKEKIGLARKIFLLLAALFITSLVVSNLIFQKFFYWYPFGIEIFGVKLFELSVGILPYPITFLITDLISEIYGKKKANEVVLVGIFASIFSISILLVSNYVPAIENSPVDDKTFNNVFYLCKLIFTHYQKCYCISFDNSFSIHYRKPTSTNCRDSPLLFSLSWIYYLFHFNQ